MLLLKRTKLLSESKLQKLRVALLLLVTLVVVPFGYAVEQTHSEKVSTSCGKLTSVLGMVDVFDPNREERLPNDSGASVPCGGWLSTQEGKVDLVTVQGHRLALAQNTMIQLTDWKKNSAAPSSQVILLRGQIHAQGVGGAPALNVETSQSWMELKQSSALLIFQKSTEKVQVISTQGSVVWSQLFQRGSTVTLRTGESSFMDPSLLRTFPSAAEPISYVDLKTRLNEVLSQPKEVAQILALVKDRKERKFAALLAPEKFKAETLDQMADGESHGHGGSQGASDSLEVALLKSQRHLEDSETNENFTPLKGTHSGRSHWTKNPAQGGSRKPASLKNSELGFSYRRPEAQPVTEKDPDYTSFVSFEERRLAGGAPNASRLVFPNGPNRESRKPAAAGGSGMKSQKKKKEENEKTQRQRLLERLNELSEDTEED